MIYARAFPPNTRKVPFGMMTSLQSGSNPVQKGIHNYTRLGMPKTKQAPGAHFPITKA